ncbi:hypothetical protein [Marinomonas sp. TW1]|uniref:hypothetical protein n=1 Tax=Marinomonas sp. TW1 TaxID=1561203 RepID=UPI0007AFAB71|nr:hypothetical protein [Marinomonas sp. TW1]KZN12611.1 hypothetical protein OA79_15160 [Marinomonas sp. TW1]
MENSNSTTKFQVYNINGIALCDAEGNNLSPFKDRDYKVEGVVGNGAIYEVSKEGLLTNLLATVSSDGTFHINETRNNSESLMCRIVSSGYTSIDFLASPKIEAIKVKLWKLHSPLYNAHQPDVDFIWWKRPVGQVGREIIFRSDGIMALKNNTNEWEFSRYRTTYNDNSRGFSISSKSFTFDNSSNWAQDSTNPTYNVDVNKNLIETPQGSSVPMPVTLYQYN